MRECRVPDWNSQLTSRAARVDSMAKVRSVTRLTRITLQLRVNETGGKGSKGVQRGRLTALKSILDVFSDFPKDEPSVNCSP
ncbi:hypothetical protein NDU88_007251 [Pleurodeles waltl]|uniref:Uncharacterized protein n=1 Tax=Pleurodeles waltl TaxID=8319 RepID=A0AAV7NVR9_PLEWA|nr:hypothetical protein NDU88_007251 [Pleurodeles waltl]